MKLSQIALTGAKKTVTVTVDDSIFASSINWKLIAQAVYIYRSNARQGTSKVKTRGEIQRTKSKWYRQKGTGRARHGARTANLFVGGGVSHGPTGLENWKKKLSASMRQAALRSALAAQAQQEKIILGAGGTEFTGKTREAQDSLQRMSENPKAKVLAIVAGDYRNFEQATRNMSRLSLTRADRVNAFEVAQADRIVIMQEAIDVLVERLGKKKPSIKPEQKTTKKVAEKTVKPTKESTKPAKKSKKVSA